MKRLLKNKCIVALAALLVFATVAYAATANRMPTGIATHYWYDYTEATRTVGDYYLYPPTLSANDEAVGKDTTQTLTNKTLTSPTVTSPTVSGGSLSDPTSITGLTTFSRAATVINSYSQLSTLTGQAAINGQSVYQLDAGKVYEVDLPALYHSLAGFDLSAVTFFVWDATAANNQKPTKITLIPSAYPSTESGTTVVVIVPYPGLSGATYYGGNASKPQSMQGERQDANGVLEVQAVASGASVYVLNKIGESVTVQTRYNSTVSAFVTDATLKK